MNGSARRLQAGLAERQAHIFLAHVLMLSMKKGEVHLLG